MAKATKAPRNSETETPVVVMRKVGPERFDIVSGVIRGVFVESKVLDKNVSLAVGRGTSRKALAEIHRKLSAALGLSVES